MVVSAKGEDSTITSQGATTAYIIFFMLGVGNLLPWNAFITAANYFHHRFCNTSHENTFESAFALTCNIAQCMCLFLVVKYQNMFPINYQVIIPFLTIASCFMLTSIFVLISMPGDQLFGITIFLVLVTGSVTAVGNGGVVGVAAWFPPKYMSAVYTGQALAGIIISVLEIVTTAANKTETPCSDDENNVDDDCSYDETSYSALSFFLLATTTLLTCVAAFRHLMEMPITKYYQAKAECAGKGDVDRERSPSVGEGEEVTNALAQSLLADDCGLGKNVGGADNTSSADKMPPLPPRLKDSTDGADTVSEGFGFTIDEIKETLKIIMVPALSVFNVYVVTIGVFPALTVLMKSTQYCETDERFYNDLYVPFLFVMFNVGDFTGRSLAGMLPPLFTKSNIWIPSLLRWGFVPLFVHTNIDGNALTNIFYNDAWPILWCLFLGMTNGYVTNLCMMFGPSMVAPNRASLAGTIMLTFLSWGLLGGAVMSFAWVSLTL